MSSSTDVVSALDVALRVAAALESLGCEYFIGGSLASSLQGEPRATNDIDLVVAMTPRHVRAFAELLGPDFEVDQEVLRDALARGSCANIFYLPMVTKIDIFALGPSPYDEVEFSRRRKVKVRPRGARLVLRASGVSRSACPGAVTATGARGAPASTGGGQRGRGERRGSWRCRRCRTRTSRARRRCASPRRCGTHRR